MMVVEVVEVMVTNGRLWRMKFEESLNDGEGDGQGEGEEGV